MRKLYPLLNVYFLLMIIAALTGWLVSCQEKEEFIPLKIFSVEPAEALIGDTILITGEGFSPGIRYNHVYFTGVGHAIIPADHSTQNRLWVIVPEKAASGPLTVNLFDEEVAESPALTVKAPVIESVEPAEGLAGDTVTIRGSNFRPEKDKNAVKFNPEAPTIAGAAVVSASGTELKVIVPLDSRTGKISVLGFEGPEFTIFPPSITRIEPLECIVGDTITITGRGLNVDPERTDILFTGSATRATILPDNTSRKLKVIVDENAKDGAITIRYPGNELASEQSLTVYPSITEISPGSGGPRTPVTINGYGFSTVESANIVRFGGVAATEVTVISAKQLQAVVPAGADTGPLTVEVNGRMISGVVPVFKISADGSPLIFAVDPPSGPVGTYTYLIGDYFSEVESENIVKFNSDSIAEVVEASRTQLKVKIPYGAVDGPVTVEVGNKEGIGPKFTLSNRLLPKIESITPAFVEPGGEFTIKGLNFAEFTKDINLRIQSGDAGNVFSPLTASADVITAKMPADLPTGEYPLQLTQYGDNATGTVTIARLPVIESISPAEGSVGTIVVLTGKNFHNIDSKNKVKFGDKEAVVTNGSNNDRNKISVQVPDDILRGVYNVTVTAFNDKVSNSDKTFRVKAKPVNVKSVYYARRIAPPGDPGTYKLEKASFTNETSGTQTIYEFTPSVGNAPYIKSLVADLTEKKAYFFLSNNTIGWSKIGTPTDTPEGGILLATTTGGAIAELSLNTEDDMLYCARARLIQKGNLATTPFTQQLIHTVPGSAVRGLTYSDDNDRLYFCELRSTPSRTRIASISKNASGTDTTTISLIASTPHTTVDIKVDYDNKKLFLLCGNGTSPSTRRRIWVADLNETGSAIVPGTLQEFLNIETETTANINGIALDMEHKYVYWIKQATGGTSGVYRKRYDGGPIPGSDPDGTGPEQEAVVEFLYPVEDQAPSSQNVFGGLAIEESGGSASHRKRGSSQRISMNLALDFNMYED